MVNKYVKENDYSSFIFIIGGAFQGKSLMSIKIAEKYNFSAILSTDLFRNILRIQNPTESILCSTSKLTEQLFNDQREEVSSLLYDILPFYSERKERIVVEGIHLSKNFLLFAKENGANCICLDNELSWKEMVNLKKITTPITKVIDRDSGQEICVKHTEHVSVEDIIYLHKEDKYRGISSLIMSEAELLGIDKVSFKELNEGFLKICNILDSSFSSI